MKRTITYNLSLSAFQKLIYKDESRFISAIAGRRVGKSTVAVDIANKHLLSKSNANIIYITSTYTQAKSVFFPLYLSRTPNKLIKKIERSSPQSITLINNSKITLHGANNYDAIRGSGYDYAILDEVPTIPYEAWSEVIRPALSDKMGGALFISTPKGINNHSYDIHTSDWTSSYSITTAEGGFVELSEIESAKKELDEKTFRQEYMATFEDATGRAYYQYSNDNYKYTDYAANRKTVLCWDFNINPSACVINQEIAPDKWCFVKEFSYPNTNTETMIDIISEYIESKGRPIHLEVTGDISGNQRRSSASHTDWYMIEKAFAGYSNYRRRIKPTLSIKDRISALNGLFRAASGDIRQYINPEQCKKLDNDFKKVVWQDSGKDIDKTNINITHLSDAASYFAYNYYPIRKEQKGFTI